MSTASLPPIAELASYTERQQADILDLLFEPSPEIHSTLVPVIRNESHSSYNSLIDSCHIRFRSLVADSTPSKPNPTLLSVLGSHPRLGAKKVDSAQSATEQAKLGGESEELARLNREYEGKFPGLRYVVFVNGRGRPEIMEDMRARIARGDFSKEVDTAIQVCSSNIAPLRDTSPLLILVNSPCVTLPRTGHPSYPSRARHPRRICERSHKEIDLLGSQIPKNIVYV